MRSLQATFVTFQKPCDEALADLSAAYNALADRIEVAWEERDKAVTALGWYSEPTFADRGVLARRVLGEISGV